MGRINEKKKKTPPLPYPGLSSPPSPSEPVQPHPHSLGEHLTLCLIDQPTVVCRSGTVSALFSVALRHLGGAHTARCRGGAAGATGPSTASEWPAQKGGHRSLSGSSPTRREKKWKGSGAREGKVGTCEGFESEGERSHSAAAERNTPKSQTNKQ